MKNFISVHNQETLQSVDVTVNYFTQISETAATFPHTLKLRSALTTRKSIFRVMCQIKAFADNVWKNSGIKWYAGLLTIKHT